MDDGLLPQSPPRVSPPSLKGADAELWVVAPGEPLAEWLRWNNLSDRVATLYGISEDELGGVLSGEVPIEADLARRLADFTGVSASFWMALEHNYRAGLAVGMQRRDD